MRRGIVMFVPTKHGIHRGVEGFLTELWIHRPYVLMHEGWSYRDPSDQYKWRGSVMFVATRHNIHRDVEGLWIQLPYVMVLP
ncbi:hypothetical protein TNCT_384181 [Trichonephila clavata]|uniref:Uncharacterized protein n=1 Tax=Trichonephila clavata TaxID=2740835 RepID=A0A8X6HI68_TRICU|nr:hypothetical protein TNCT_384181 [Trichonephila clavata]